jgi:signal transduction histidine kinase/ActR/RegA family two-component response regulator
LSGAEKGDVEKLLRQQTILAKFGELALRSDDLDLILTEACRLVGEAMGTDLAKVVELQEGGETLKVRAGVGWKPGVVGVATITIGDDTSESHAFKMGQPMISPDIEGETRFRYPAFLTENGVRAVANVLIIGGKDRPPFGLLQVDSRAPRSFTDNDTTFLSGYANLIAAAVDRLRIIKDLHSREEQLRQAQKLEAIGRLAAGVAHDFNNILQSVTGGLELVLDDVQAGSSAHEFATIALASTVRGSNLTHHLLSYARRQIMQPKLLEVAPFLSEMQQMLSRTLGLHIAVEVRVDQALPRILVDLGQLQTALLNLAINALHAMPKGGPLLLHARVESGNRKHVVIAVADTGVGMDQATLGQAFEPFFTTKGLGGSGLGLSMVQGFVRQSGGEVHIESAPGKGTKVELWLPAAEAASRPNEQQTIPAELRGSGRILLVDDAPDVLIITSAFLETAGFDVVRAVSGDQALAFLALGERFDALVTDYAMPAMNGVELLQRVRAVQPGLAALIITGFADAGAADSLPDSVAVLRKPFQRLQFIEAVLRTVGQDPSSTTDGDGTGLTPNAL